MAAGLRVAAMTFLMNMTLVEMPSPAEVKRSAGRLDKQPEDRGERLH